MEVAIETVKTLAKYIFFIAVGLAAMAGIAFGFEKIFNLDSVTASISTLAVMMFALILSSAFQTAKYVVWKRNFDKKNNN